MKYKTFQTLVFVGLGLGALATGGIIYAMQSHEQAAVAQPPRALPAQEPLRAMDRAILARVEQNIPGDKVKDAFQGEPYKVNLYRDAGNAAVNRLKIDLDRDELWDEKWTFDRTGAALVVRREVSARDNDRYDATYLLQGDHWVRQ